LGESTKVEIAADGTFVRIWPFPTPPRRRSSNDPQVVHPRPQTRRNKGIGVRQTTIGENLPASLAPRRILLPAAALLLLALSVLLSRPAPSLAKAASACPSSAAARAKRHVRACAGRHRSAHAHAKVKGRHAKRNHSKKKQGKAKGKAHAPAAVQQPATCEDGTTPKRDGEGEFACGDGSGPICANGAEPVAKHSGARLLCPVAAGPEFSEASCEDGSAPERGEGGSGSFACEDGSRPSCEDGSRPTLSDDGSMLVCISAAGAGSSTPPSEEESEETEEAEADSRRASA
jgi:hypothetical protein